MYCWVKNDTIQLLLSESASFSIANGNVSTIPWLGPDGVNYPPGWLNSVGSEWAATNGLLPLVITGDSTQDAFHQTDYADSVINGVPTRTYTRILKPQAECQSYLYAQVAALRWQKETGPFTASGITLTLSDATTTRIGQAIQLFDKDPALTSISWKLGPSTFVTLDKATMTALGVAIGSYTQQLFVANKTHCAAIAALTAAQCATYDYTTGWPSNGA